MNAQQNPTTTDTLTEMFGSLSPLQLRAATLLASGRTIQTIAEELNIHRSTLWEWRQMESFQAYYNALLKDLQRHSIEGILSLQETAIETLLRIMANGSDTAALRAAEYILQCGQTYKAGSTDPKELIRERYSEIEESEHERALNELMQPKVKVDEEAYHERCKELGLPQSDENFLS